jgi:glycerol-3-phosphate acyltransferase PlsY
MMASVLYSVLIGYVLGAIPTGVIVAKLWCGGDVLRTGSGHTGGANTARVTGNAWAGAVTAVIDVGLSAVAVFLSGRLSDTPWAPALAGAAAVLGHDWSAYIGFRGGIGISSLAGMLLAQAPLVTLIAGVVVALIWLALRVKLGHDARSTIVVMFILPVLLWALREPQHVLVSGGLGALAVIARSFGDWRRAYEPGEGALVQFGLQRESSKE